MKNFNIKSKKGFTLIELLVVIGILAVLAAIAIPSVAGLIDRANVSADNTNANEMTNALERFASEYELYCQDIASGSVNPADLDSAQGRVYNVTKATTRADITKLESEDGLNGVKINRDTKYPMNHDTMKAIIENYMKTSSSTFEPKQSDCHYYYSPDCGIIICAETNKGKIEDLNKLIVSGKDAKGNKLSAYTKWLNITENKIILFEHGEIIPENATYTVNSTGEILTAGNEFPNTMKYNDTYVYGDYKYILMSGGWGVYTIDKTKDAYGPILEIINSRQVTRMEYAFQNCTNLVDASKIIIPTTVTTMLCTFDGCSRLEIPPQIPYGVTSMQFTFQNCRKLKISPKIPDSVINMYNTFDRCLFLTTKPIIPNSVTTSESDIFSGCTQFGY